MRYLLLATLIISGCGYEYSWEPELENWYKHQIMWEKYNQVQRAKQANPDKKVEAVRSRQLETMWYSMEKLRSPEKIEKRPTTSDDPLRAWASRQPLPPIMPEPDMTPRHKEVPREDLKAGEKYWYFPATGGEPYVVEILFAKYRSTFGVSNIIKWRRIYDSGRRGELESSKTGTFKTLHKVAPPPPKIVYEETY